MIHLCLQPLQRLRDAACKACAAVAPHPDETACCADRPPCRMHLGLHQKCNFLGVEALQLASSAHARALMKYMRNTGERNRALLHMQLSHLWEARPARPAAAAHFNVCMRDPLHGRRADSSRLAGQLRARKIKGAASMHPSRRTALQPMQV